MHFIWCHTSVFPPTLSHTCIFPCDLHVPTTCEVLHWKLLKQKDPVPNPLGRGHWEAPGNLMDHRQRDGLGWPWADSPCPPPSFIFAVSGTEHRALHICALPLSYVPNPGFFKF